jgi:hypothetical protein
MVKNAQRALRVLLITAQIPKAFALEGNEEVSAHYEWIVDLEKLFAELLGRDDLISDERCRELACKLAAADGD